MPLLHPSQSPTPTDKAPPPTDWNSPDYFHPRCPLRPLPTITDKNWFQSFPSSSLWFMYSRILSLSIHSFILPSILTYIHPSLFLHTLFLSFFPPLFISFHLFLFSLVPLFSHNSIPSFLSSVHLTFPTTTPSYLHSPCHPSTYWFYSFILPSSSTLFSLQTPSFSRVVCFHILRCTTANEWLSCAFMARCTHRCSHRHLGISACLSLSITVAAAPVQHQQPKQHQQRQEQEEAKGAIWRKNGGYIVRNRWHSILSRLDPLPSSFDPPFDILKPLPHPLSSAVLFIIQLV